MNNQSLRHFTFALMGCLILLPGSGQVRAELSGLDHERDLNYGEAIIQYRKEIEASEAASGEFDLNLFPRLMGLARSLRNLGELDAAIDAAQRAQHISHRHQGVHNTLQLEAVALLTQIHLNQSDPLEADQQQKFAYYIRKSNVPEDSLELLPAIEELSTWYENTGQLHRARKLHEQSIEIVEAHFGPDTEEQLPYLQKLAKLKRLQRVCCSTRIMKQALAVVEANPNIEDGIKAQTYLELADAYTISGDKDQASTFYQSAWNVMNDTERQQHFAAPMQIAFSRPLTAQTGSVRVFRPERDLFGNRDYRQLREDEIRELENLPPQEFVLNTDNAEYDVRIRDRRLPSDYDKEPAVRTVGQPYSFLHSQFLQILPHRLRSDEALDGLRVELMFDIDSGGKPYNIEVISNTAVPTKVARLMRDVVRKSRFRPRLKDGYPVDTAQYRMTQSFAAKITKSPEII